MTERELTPAEEARVRRLLAEARLDEPMPGEVAERLDAVLRDLATERASATAAATVAPVVDLAARRRRRRATGLLVAAAAVTVIGVGVPQLTGGLIVGSSSDDSAGSAELAPNSAAEGRDGAELDKGGAGDPEDMSAVPQASAPTRELQGAKRYRLRSDLTAARDTAMTMAFAEADPAWSACRGDADWGSGTTVLVTYDDQPAALVFRAPTGERQRVDLYLCGTDVPARTVRLPAP